MSTRQRSVGFLGPAGTFTEEALVSQEDLAGMRHQPFNSMFEVLESVESGGVDLGLASPPVIVTTGRGSPFSKEGDWKPYDPNRTRVGEACSRAPRTRSQRRSGG